MCEGVARSSVRYLQVLCVGRHSSSALSVCPCYHVYGLLTRLPVHICSQSTNVFLSNNTLYCYSQNNAKALVTVAVLRTHILVRNSLYCLAIFR